MLSSPALLVEVEEPVQATVGVLVDDSRSMQVPDLAGKPRSEFVNIALGPGDQTTLGQLQRRFHSPLLAFADEVRLIQSPDELQYTANATRLGDALRSGLETFADERLAALVLFSDGGDNSGGRVPADLRQVMLELIRKQVPVYTVVTSPPQPMRDLEVSGLGLPARVLSQDTVQGRALVRHHGLAGKQVELRLEHLGRVLLQQQFRLPAEGQPAVRKLQFDPPGPGYHRLDVVVELVEPKAGEDTFRRNNRDQAVLTVDDRVLNVLHYEGEPRFEVKFLRRAVHGDQNIDLVSLVRTAEHKHYRLGVKNPSHLKDGFPRTAAELFAFDAVVLGSVATTELDAEQQRLLADFVARRGGGLVALGGHRSFVRGGYVGQPLAKVLPVDLEPTPVHIGQATNPESTPPSSTDTNPRRASEQFGYRRMARIFPTPDGRQHNLLRRLLPSQSDAWDRLPRLTVVNPLRRLKPGATLLLAGDDRAVDSPPVADALSILSVQRYGRGHAAAFAVRDTWRWQINRDIEPDDQTHETLWRQMLRWLAWPAPGRVSITVHEVGLGQPNWGSSNPDSAGNRFGRRQVPAGRALEVAVRVMDEAFKPVSTHKVQLRMTTPLGDVVERNLTWSGAEISAYRDTIRTADPGVYELRVAAHPAEPSVSSPSSNAPVEGRAEPLIHTVFIAATADGREFFGLREGRGLLQDLSARTGGKFFEAQALLDDPELLARSISEHGATRLVDQRLPLWDVPLLALVLLALLCGEWALRRRVGLK